MKSFLVSMMIAALSISICYGAKVNYWRCSHCGIFHVGEVLPKPKKCSYTNYQQFHNWVKSELCYAGDNHEEY